MFNEEKCDFCGDCLARCAYVDYDKERAASEIRDLIDGKEAPILSRCITCYACNEYCPQEARPFDLILERMEQYHSFPAPPDIVAGQEQFFTPGTPIKLEKTADKVMSACVFGNTEAELFQGRLFEGLPILKGRHFFCYILFDHLGAGSVTKKHIQGYVDSLAASGAKEIVLFHDDCYGALVDVAPQIGVKVPFRPVHVVEYLRDYLRNHKDELRPLNLPVAYQRPCASRLSPAKEPAIDAIFELIGVERVERRYDREDALCCSGAIAQFDAERAAALRARNLEDAKAAGAQAMAYLCPMCRRVLSPDAESRGLANYHVIELVRMSLGEPAAP
jgi:Fe-S oxidoreductase